LGVKKLSRQLLKTVGLTAIISITVLLMNTISSNSVFNLIMDMRDTHYLEGESKSKEMLFIFFWLIVPVSFIISSLIIYFRRR